MLPGARGGKKSWEHKLRSRSRALNQNLPKSEEWFWARWNEMGMTHSSDRANVPVGYYIADVLSNAYWYAIEVDGGYHTSKIQKERDFKKDCFFLQQGILIYRVAAYDELGLEIVAAKIRRIRQKGIKAAKKRYHKNQNYIATKLKRTRKKRQGR